jgi:hypothetical protein
MDYHQLHKTRVVELREMAAKYGVEGVSAMKKEQIVDFLVGKLGIDRHAHGALGLNKATVKKQLHDLKSERDKAITAHDRKALKQARRKRHRLKREIRRAIARAAAH